MIRLFCLLIAGTSIAVTAGSITVLDVNLLGAIADGRLTTNTTFELVSAMALVLTICVVIFATQSDHGQVYGDDAETRLDAAREAAFEYAPWVPTIWLSARRGRAPTYSPFRNEIRWPVWLITALSRDQVCRATVAYCRLALARRKLCMWQLVLYCGLVGIPIGVFFIWLAVPLLLSGAFLLGGIVSVLLSMIFTRRLHGRILQSSEQQWQVESPPQPLADVRDLAEHKPRDRIADNKKEVA